MKASKAISSTVLYIVALAISLLGTMWIASVHLDLWRQGKFIFGPFVAPVVVGYVVASLVAWGVARWLAVSRKGDVAFAVVTVIPFALLAVMRSQDWVG